VGVPLDPRNRRAEDVPTVKVIPAYSPRIVIRTLFITVAFAVALYLVYLLRKPIGWVLVAAFLAVALSGPVNFLSQWIRRGFAITLVYFCLLLVPIGIGALIIPPLVTQGNNLIQNLPQYAQDVQDYTNKNARLRKIEADYNITQKLQQQAEKLPARIGDAANVLGNIGLGVVNSLFALFTILVLTAFLLGSGSGWVNRALELRPAEHSARMRTALDHMGRAVGAYVGGAIAQATLAAVLAYVVLAILGVPFAGALAIVIFFADLVPLVGATIGAVLVGIVTIFGDFPTATIVWVIYSIVYQQVENTLIQPQIQKRAVNVHPFLVLVAVLFGSTLLGVLGALVAIPIAASVQIAIREWWDYRHDQTVNEIIAPAGPTPADTPPPASTA
jgi:predicted PurR-regulated permease PerM